MDKDDDLSKFSADDDSIKPIDTGAPEPKRPSKPLLPGQDPAQAYSSKPLLPGQEAPQDGEAKAVPENPEAKKKPVFAPEDMALSDDVGESNAAKREREEQEKLDALRAKEVEKAFEGDVNYINKGEYVDLIEKVPILKRMMIGAGWQKRLVEGETLDVDISVFLLNKSDQTREDGDFIFYNNPKACDGAVHHMGDSRTGAGDGDDENIFIDLNGLPFDIMKIVFVFSLYDPEIKGHHFGMIRKMYLRICNKDDGREIVRYALNEDDKNGGNAIIVGTLIREGPRWIFEATAEQTNGGLAKFATDYGILIKELQSTGEENLGGEEQSDFADDGALRS